MDSFTFHTFYLLTSSLQKSICSSLVHIQTLCCIKKNFLRLGSFDALHYDWKWEIWTIYCLEWYWTYSRVQKNWNEVFFKILEEPSIVQKKMIPHIKGLDFSQRWSKKKIKMADLENSKWPPQKNLVFQLRQFSIFFHEIFMVWSLG